MEAKSSEESSHNNDDTEDTKLGAGTGRIRTNLKGSAFVLAPGSRQVVIGFEVFC